MSRDRSGRYGKVDVVLVQAYGNAEFLQYDWSERIWPVSSWG